MKPYKVIVNPVAGHGNGLRSIPNIVRLLDKHELSYDLVRTERRWHAAEITRKAVDEGYEVIVAVGGDGTVNEVINGLMQAKQDGLSVPALGNLCVGRGNDFAGGVGIPADLEQGCLALAENHRRTIDIGRVFGGIHPQGRYFGNCVGIGFDAIATIEVAKLPRWGGFTSFLMAVFKTVFLYNNAPLATIIYDDRKITQRSLMISIMNGWVENSSWRLIRDPMMGCSICVLLSRCGRCGSSR
jgi:YegS/Rv2252/BmrU family lipid kinase